MLNQSGAYSRTIYIAIRGFGLEIIFFDRVLGRRARIVNKLDDSGRHLVTSFVLSLGADRGL